MEQEKVQAQVEIWFRTILIVDRVFFQPKDFILFFHLISYT